MAKKKTARRVPRVSEPRMYGDGKPSQAASREAGRPGAPAATTPAAQLAGSPRIPVTVTRDYHYVVNDLRRLGIIAAGTFAVLIVLGLIIR